MFGGIYFAQIYFAGFVSTTTTKVVSSGTTDLRIIKQFNDLTMIEPASKLINIID